MEKGNSEKEREREREREREIMFYMGIRKRRASQTSLMEQG